MEMTNRIVYGQICLVFELFLAQPAIIFINSLLNMFCFADKSYIVLSSFILSSTSLNQLFHMIFKLTKAQTFVAMQEIQNKIQFFYIFQVTYCFNLNYTTSILFIYSVLCFFNLLIIILIRKYSIKQKKTTDEKEWKRGFGFWHFITDQFNKNNIHIWTSYMKPASSVSKVSDEQAKTKKLNITKNIIAQRQSSKPFERLKSNQEPEPESNISKLLKPRSSMGRRPLSSQKYSETANSLATTSSAKSEQQVKQIINTIFCHSKKLQNFLTEKNLQQNKALEALLNNQLFTLSLVTMVSNKNPQQINKYVQRSCIHKLDRMIAMEKQKGICDNLEIKIGELIDKRIKALSFYQ